MIQTAIILAGGFGTRLQDVVREVPKPMAPINRIPFLDYQLNYLKYFGIKKVILSVGYLSGKIESYYKNHFNGIEISYAFEKEPLGTGGATKAVLKGCEENEALVLNGDSFFDISLTDFFFLHRKRQSQISLALRKVNDASRYGTIVSDDLQNIVSFKEKSLKTEAGVINAGIYILNKETFLQHTPVQLNFSIEKDFFEKQVGKLDMKGFEFEGYFIDIGLPEDYNKAQNDFKEFKYR